MKNSETAFDFIINNREEIEEIFQDLIDIGYEFNIATYHTNGKFNKIEKQYLDKIKSYYYGFEISLDDRILDGFKIKSYMTLGNQKTLTIKYNPTNDIEKAMKEEKDFSNRNKFSTVMDTIFSEIMSVLGEGFRNTGDKSNTMERYFIFNGPVRVLEISMRMEEPSIDIHNKGIGKQI